VAGTMPIRQLRRSESDRSREGGVLISSLAALFPSRLDIPTTWSETLDRWVSQDLSSPLLDQ
jgi:hypothetical protein